MRQLGVHEDILISYLCHNLKISEKKSKEILNCIEDFYDKMIKQGIAKTIMKQPCSGTG
jgi:hypothetical protein